MGVFGRKVQVCVFRYKIKFLKGKKDIDIYKMRKINEKVVSNKVKKLYSVGEISKCIRFGIKNGYKDKDSDDIINWVKSLLSGKNVDL